MQRLLASGGQQRKRELGLEQRFSAGQREASVRGGVIGGVVYDFGHDFGDGPPATGQSQGIVEANCGGGIKVTAFVARESGAVVFATASANARSATDTV